MNAVSKGKDALGEVFVHVGFHAKSYTGKAASVDIIDASARAYLNAVNKAMYEKHGLEQKTLKAASASNE